jgi:hypothetical protein
MIDDIIAMYDNKMVKQLAGKMFETVYPPYYNYKIKEPLQLMIAFPKYTNFYGDKNENC